jgi:hypothetical protein
LRIKPAILFAVCALLLFPSDSVAPTAQAQYTPLAPAIQGTYDQPAKPLKYDVDAVLCNCYLYSKLKYPNLPGTTYIKSHLQKDVAEIAVFDYNGLEHYAVVESFSTTTITLKETNYKRCTKGTRTISRSDPALIGFYDATK